MSIGGNGDDDDIEEKLDRVIDELSELNRTLSRALQPAEEIEEGEEPDQGDIWEEGQSSSRVRSVDEYKRKREQAANSPNMTLPFFGSVAFDSWEEKMQARYELFKQGYDSLESLWSGVGREAFDRIMVIYALDYLNPEGRQFATTEIREDLVEILDPGAGFFGVKVVQDEVVHSEPDSPLDFRVVGGQFYHPEANPINVLNLQDVSVDDVFDSIGGMLTGEVNRKMALAILERRSLELPDEHKDLVSPEEIENLGGGDS